MIAYLKIFIILSAISLAYSDSIPLTSRQLQKFRQAILQAHNNFRSDHNAQDLVESSSIDNMAQAYAQKIAASGKLVHSGTPNYGENLFVAYNSDPNFLKDTSAFANQCVQSWYDENQYYDYDNPGYSSDTGHFTQVVWKSTTKLGCGVSTGTAVYQGYKYYTAFCVCNYYPPGNYIDQFQDNVE